MYDPAQAANLVKDVVRREFQASMGQHQPTLQAARQQQEYAVVFAKHGKEPDFERKAALTNQLIQGNPSVSFEATYNLVSTIQQSLGSTKAAPAQVANNAG